MTMPAQERKQNTLNRNKKCVKKKNCFSECATYFYLIQTYFEESIKHTSISNEKIVFQKTKHSK